jgi:hypothetical protein
VFSQRGHQGADEVEVAAGRQAQDETAGQDDLYGDGGGQEADRDEAGGLFDRRLKASAPGVEGRGGHAFFGTEGNGGQAGAFKALEALPPEIRKSRIRTPTRTDG